MKKKKKIACPECGSKDIVRGIYQEYHKGPWSGFIKCNSCKSETIGKLKNEPKTT